MTQRKFIIKIKIAGTIFYVMCSHMTPTINHMTTPLPHHVYHLEPIPCSTNHTHSQSHKYPSLLYVPSGDYPLLHKPPKLPLREDCVLKVEATVLIHIRLPDVQVLAEPAVLGITIVVLSGTQGVGHTFNTVHYGTGKVVGGINPREGGRKEGGREGGRKGMEGNFRTTKEKLAEQGLIM